MTAAIDYDKGMADEQLEEAIFVRITKQDREDLKALCTKLGQKEASVARIALRIGLGELAHEPARLFYQRPALNIVESGGSQFHIEYTDNTGLVQIFEVSGIPTVAHALVAQGQYNHVARMMTWSSASWDGQGSPTRRSHRELVTKTLNLIHQVRGK